MITDAGGQGVFIACDTSDADQIDADGMPSVPVLCTSFANISAANSARREAWPANGRYSRQKPTHAPNSPIDSMFLRRH